MTKVRIVEKDIELVKGIDFAVRCKLDEGAKEAAI
jgi:hypothetical protein